MKKRIINASTPFADVFPLSDGRFALNAPNGVACTLTCAHHFAGNITHPRQGFREMGVLTIINSKNQKEMEEKQGKKPLNLPKELEGYEFRIRKLTPREVFRIMDVDDEYIDKIQATGLSKSSQYKLGGNSIVTSCLYYIFKKLIIEPENESTQLTLF